MLNDEPSNVALFVNMTTHQTRAFWSGVGLMLGQDRRRCPNIETKLDKCILFAWKMPYHICVASCDVVPVIYSYLSSLFDMAVNGLT